MHSWDIFVQQLPIPVREPYNTGSSVKSLLFPMPARTQSRESSDQPEKHLDSINNALKEALSLSVRVDVFSFL